MGAVPNISRGTVLSNGNNPLTAARPLYSGSRVKINPLNKCAHGDTLAVFRADITNNFAAVVEGPPTVRTGQTSGNGVRPELSMNSFSPAALGQSRHVDCPVFDQLYRPVNEARAGLPLRSIVWGVIFSSPFWILAGIGILYLTK